MNDERGRLPMRRKGAWGWLAYSGFLFIQPLVDPTWHEWRLALGAFAVFLVIFALYIRSVDRQSPLRYWMIGATFVLGLIVFPRNGGASTFFVYTAAFLPFTVASTRRLVVLFALESVCVFLDGHYFHAGTINTLIAIFLLLVIGCGNIFFAQQNRADAALRAAQEENIALAALAERERIARDLHDVLGHTLSVISMKAELAARLLARDTSPTADATRAASEIADVAQITRTALAEVREAIGGYRARGLGAEIEAARRTLAAAGVQLEYDAVSLANAGLRANEETVLSLALREAVTNIVRHARATTCTLRIDVECGQHRLMVRDNGGGKESLREGDGLRGMRERVEGLGGALSVEHDGGVRLLVALPVQAGATR